MSLRRSVATDQGLMCFYCGRSLAARYYLVHLLPPLKGGTHDRSNRVAACGTCAKENGCRRPTAEELSRQARILEWCG